MKKNKKRGLLILIITFLFLIFFLSFFSSYFSLTGKVIQEENSVDAEGTIWVDKICASDGECYDSAYDIFADSDGDDQFTNGMTCRFDKCISDQCLNNDDLNETYFNGSSIVAKIYNCKNGCVNDYCIKDADPLRSFSHIRTYVFNLNNSFDRNWVRRHIDLATFNIGAKKTIIYVSWTDLKKTRREFSEVQKLFVSANQDINDLFYHFKKDAYLSPSRISMDESAQEDKFYRIFKFENNNYADITNSSYGYYEAGYYKSPSFPSEVNISISNNSGDIVYIGNIWKFDEINFNISIPSSSNFNMAAEYWNGNSWASLVINDGTNKMHQSGKIRFFPPKDWNIINTNSETLFYIRFRNLAGIGPILKTKTDITDFYHYKGNPAISGKKYQTILINDQANIIIPGWNSSNDLDKDGYISDPEFNNIKDINATARFKQEAVIPVWYLTDRWGMNFNNSIYASYVVSSTLKAGYLDGVFMDNSVCKITSRVNTFDNTLEYENEDDYLKDHKKILEQVKQNLSNRTPPGIVIINGENENFFRQVPRPQNCPDLTYAVDGQMTENSISYNFATGLIENERFLKMYYNRVLDFCRRGKIVIIGALQDRPSQISLERSQLYSLARYYLTSSDCTYLYNQLSIQYPNQYPAWFTAIEYDIGSPTGDFYSISSDIFARNFTNALIIMKSFPNWDANKNVDVGENTAEEIALDGTYFPLFANGTLGLPINKIKLRNYESSILIRNKVD